MAGNCLAYYVGDISTPNVVTREFGLRQQAMYLRHYRLMEEQ
jgi:hypothetical protein